MAKINQRDVDEIHKIADLIIEGAIQLRNMELDETTYITMQNDISKEFFIGLNKKSLLDKYLDIFSEINHIFKKIKKFQEQNNFIILVIEKIYSRIISLVNEFILSKCSGCNNNDNIEAGILNSAYLTRILVSSQIDFIEKTPIFFAKDNIAISKLTITIVIKDIDTIVLGYELFFDLVEQIWLIQVSANSNTKSDIEKIVFYDNGKIVYDETIISQINSENIQIINPKIERLLVEN